MPDTPAFLARNRLAYVGSHSFVLLIGVLALTGSVTYFHDRSGPAYRVMGDAVGPGFLELAYTLLAIGGSAVILGLVFLWLPVEAVGHSLICTGIVMTGIVMVKVSSFGFATVISTFTVAFTVVCILFRLWALFDGIRRPKS